MRVPEDPVCSDLFRQNPAFTSLQLKSPVHVTIYSILTVYWRYHLLLRVYWRYYLLLRVYILEVPSIAEIVGLGLTFAYCAACNNRHDGGDNRNRLQEATYSHNLPSGAGIQIKGNCYRSQGRRKYIFISQYSK